MLHRARVESRVCVTLIHGFHQILSQTGADRPSVIFVRLQSLNATATADLIENVCIVTEEDLASGAAVTAHSG